MCWARPVTPSSSLPTSPRSWEVVGASGTELDLPGGVSPPPAVLVQRDDGQRVGRVRRAATDAAKDVERRHLDPVGTAEEDASAAEVCLVGAARQPFALVVGEVPQAVT